MLGGTVSLLTVIHCQVMTRPPFYELTVVGVGPYLDWLEDSPILTVDSQTQIPIVMVGKSCAVISVSLTHTSVSVNGDMRGGMSSTELVFTVGTTSFINYLEPFK